MVQVDKIVRDALYIVTQNASSAIILFNKFERQNIKDERHWLACILRAN